MTNLSHNCKDSQITSLKLHLVLIVTHFVNFKHNFPKEIETLKKIIKKFHREKLEDETVFVNQSINEIIVWFWFWFSNQQDSFTNMIADGSAWGLMCQFRLK